MTYQHNPQFQASKENFDLMSDIYREHMSELIEKARSLHPSRNNYKNKTDKESAEIRRENLNILIHNLKKYQECANNLVEQYYFLYKNEESNKNHLKLKLSKFKRYASDKGVDVSLIEWL